MRKMMPIGAYQIITKTTRRIASFIALKNATRTPLIKNRQFRVQNRKIYLCSLVRNSSDGKRKRDGEEKYAEDVFAWPAASMTVA